MDSTYKIIGIVGSSPKSWEDAIEKAVADAAKSLRDIRIASVDELDCKIEEGKVVAYRVRFRLSFKFETG
ncbi:MAG: dodecin family protein, partial [Candidatus Hodarchaeales archaeon]